jgi:hypothetical protein
MACNRDIFTFTFYDTVHPKNVKMEKLANFLNPESHSYITAARGFVGYMEKEIRKFKAHSYFLIYVK